MRQFYGKGPLPHFLLLTSVYGLESHWNPLDNMYTTGARPLGNCYVCLKSYPSKHEDGLLVP